jgi:hypothetical protein
VGTTRFRLALFHQLADPGSAEARQRVVALGLEKRVAFCNVVFESHRAALAELGGGETPALWDGRTLHVGLRPVLAALEAVARD